MNETNTYIIIKYHTRRCVYCFLSFLATMLRHACILLSVVSTNVRAKVDVPRNCQKGSDSFQRPTTMAHRGLPGYELEHDYPGYMAAIAVGAQYVEYDVTMTKDDQLIVVHDTWLDSEYNSADIFPNLRKNLSLVPALDGDAINTKQVVWQHDLTYNEIVNSGLCKSYDKFQSRYPGRVVIGGTENCLKPLRVIDATPTLERKRKERKVNGKPGFGLVVELKRPRFYEALGKDMATPLAKALTTFTGNVIIQCFEPLYLQRMKELEKKLTDDGTKAAGSPPWIYLQLTIDADTMRSLGYPETKKGVFGDKMYTLADALDVAVPDDESKFDAYMNKISRYATIFSPWKKCLQPVRSDLTPLQIQQFFQTKEGQKRGRNLVASARKHGLETMPYTFRSDVKELPRIYKSDASAEMKHYFELGCTGIFTDFAGAGVKAAADFCKTNLRVLDGSVNSYLNRLPILLAFLCTFVSDLL